MRDMKIQMAELTAELEEARAQNSGPMYAVPPAPAYPGSVLPCYVPFLRSPATPSLHRLLFAHCIWPIRRRGAGLDLFSEVEEKREHLEKKLISMTVRRGIGRSSVCHRASQPARLGSMRHC